MCDTDLYHMKGLSVRFVIVCVCVCVRTGVHAPHNTCACLLVSGGAVDCRERDTDQALPPVHEERDWC